MKKLPTILLASLLLLAACGNNSHSDDNSNKDNNRRVVKGKTKHHYKKQLKEYEKYTDGQLDKFLDGTEKFVAAIKADDMDKAKELYPKSTYVL